MGLGAWVDGRLPGNHIYYLGGYRGYVWWASGGYAASFRGMVVRGFSTVWLAKHVVEVLASRSVQ